MATQTAKEPIRLRRRTISDGRQSLYLDIYLNGKRSYEYLKLYLVPERTSEDKRRNQQTMMFAEAVKARRLVDLQNDRFGFEGRFKTDTPFLDFFYKLCEERKGTPASKGNWGNWYSCYVHLQVYLGKRKDTLTFREITPEWCEGWRRYLDKTAICQNRYNKNGELSDKIPLSQSSKQSYWAKFKACLAEARDRHIIPDDPAKGIKGFRVDQAERVYLTLDEVRRMAATPCHYPGLRRAFLFSCLTGLRKSDILKLTWREVKEEGGFTRIIFRQQKTKGLEYLDLSPEAVQFMGERRKPDDLVFNDFVYSASSNAELRMWAAKAGVAKDFSFHCGRHTFAVLMIDLGTDIYTLQKLLGHREIHTTQIYANLMDKKKQDAVARIPSLGLPAD